MDAEEPPITLVSKDGESFTVARKVAVMSELVKSTITGTILNFLVNKNSHRFHDGSRCIRKVCNLPNKCSYSLLDNEDEDESVTPEIPLPNVKSQVLQKVIEFCEHHLSDPMNEIEKPLKSKSMADVVQKWYADFVDLEQVLLFELILAANYMDIKPLLDLTCATVASMIKGKTPEEIRATFNITNDFTPEEEAQVRDENKWCESS
ncbi:hypothetical protein MPSEU_000255500 [Mayamaea pseudoterrestris]|nr:hypothetical protein MPSEU_000255500 [Mayamaea pseudoterrestris]